MRGGKIGARLSPLALIEPSWILSLVVGTALAFDFSDGFHDTANAMATSIATGAFTHKTAVSVAAVLNLVGAFLSLSVAATIASGIVLRTSSPCP